MFPANFAATPGATTDPDPVLGHSGPGQGWQLGDVGEIHSLFGQLATAAGAELPGDWHLHGWFCDLIGRRSLAEGECAFPRLAAGAFGLLGAGASGEGGGLAFGTPLELLVFSNQGLVAGSQLGYLLLQGQDLTLQLRYQGKQVFSAQRLEVYRGIHGMKCSPLAPGQQPLPRRGLIKYQEYIPAGQANRRRLLNPY